MSPWAADLRQSKSRLQAKPPPFHVDSILAAERILGLVARPVEALAAIPLETRRFEDLGALAAIPLETRRFEDLGGYLFEPMLERVGVAQQQIGELLGERTVWWVNSTALGGGVAQLLRTLLPYWRGAGIDVRWMVLHGSAEFFRVTKRFHNHLQGQPGDRGAIGTDELTTFDRAGHYHAGALASLLAPGDVVVLNDPQTAAMSVPLKRAGASVIWSCHVGIDHDNELSRNAWSCLMPRLAGVNCFVFSRYASLRGRRGDVDRDAGD
jgi:trehalose synthase